jgi:hypothetical protein
MLALIARRTRPPPEQLSVAPSWFGIPKALSNSASTRRSYTVAMHGQGRRRDLLARPVHRHLQRGVAVTSWRDRRGVMWVVPRVFRMLASTPASPVAISKLGPEIRPGSAHMMFIAATTTPI